MGTEFVGAAMPKALTELNQKFSFSSSQAELELILFWTTSGNNRCHNNTFSVFFLFVILWVLYSSNLCTDFYHIFQKSLGQEELEFIWFFPTPGSKCCHGNTFSGLWTSTFQGIYSPTHTWIFTKLSLTVKMVGNLPNVWCSPVIPAGWVSGLLRLAIFYQ